MFSKINRNLLLSTALVALPTLGFACESDEMKALLETYMQPMLEANIDYFYILVVFKFKHLVNLRFVV